MEFKLLSHKEEQQLTDKEKSIYYQKLCDYVVRRKLTNTTPGATTIAPKLKSITGKICEKLCKVLAGGEVEVIVDGTENVPDGPVIFASTHQGILDNFVWIPGCPKHCIIFHGAETNKLLLLAQVNTGLILVLRNIENSENRISAKLDMMTVLLKGHSVFICPEGTWNLSPNRLHLPINLGFLDVAQKTGVPIVPTVIEYTYDSSSEKEKIIRVYIRYGTALWVKQQDSLFEKLEEYKESISTIRWELIEEKGLFCRRDIPNNEYANYVKGNLRNLALGKIDINRENKGIYGGKHEFYKFYYINNVDTDEEGTLLETAEMRRLKLLNRLHGI